jgi:anaerobic selenocysteine-containing dehydrogenase
MVANVAAGDRAGDEVPDASDEEVKLFLASRRHLPKTVFDAARWEQIVGAGLWRKVIYVLNRGGRFQDADKAYDGEKVANKYGTLINLYQEKTAKTKNAMTGKLFPGLATYIPAPLDSLGRAIEDRGYDLRLITFREISHTKSRTAADYWLLHLLPENSLILNEVDAKRLGLKDGQTVKLASATNPEGVWDLANGQKRPMAGKLRVIQGIRPGVVAFSLGHGHWAYGSADVRVDGKVVKGDPRRGKGLHGNAAMRVDPVLGNTCLEDPTGGSAVFYDTQVKLVKV